MPPEHTLNFTLPELIATAMAVHLQALDPDLPPKVRLFHAKIALRFNTYLRAQNPDSSPTYHLINDHLQELCAHLHLLYQSPQQN